MIFSLSDGHNGPAGMSGTSISPCLSLSGSPDTGLVGTLGLTGCGVPPVVVPPFVPPVLVLVVGRLVLPPAVPVVGR